MKSKIIARLQSCFVEPFETTQDIVIQKLSLLYYGMHIEETIKDELLSSLLVQRRAGLGSGIEIMIPTRHKNLWVNVPVTEKFVQNSPYCLHKDETGYYVGYHEGESRNHRRGIEDMEPYNPANPQSTPLVRRWPVYLATPPSWYSKTTSRGILMNQIGVMQGTYLGIYVGKPCAFWTMSPPQQCQFCATGLNVGKHEAEEKTVQDVVETALEAKRVSHINFVHLNSGYQEDKDLALVLPYIQALKREVGVLVGVQCIPSENMAEYDALIKAGVDHFSFCYELHDKECFARYLPGKNKHIGQKRFFQAMKYVCRKMPKGSVSGEIIAGLEPYQATMQAIDYITSLGAFPTVCLFRPLAGTALQDAKPTINILQSIAIFKKVAKSCRERGIPVGLAPNLEVSIVMTPDDCRYLCNFNFAWFRQHYRLKLLKLLATPYFKLKQSKWHF